MNIDQIEIVPVEHSSRDFEHYEMDMNIEIP